MVPRHALRSTPALLAALLAACGGSSPDAPTSEAVAADLAALERQVARLEDSKAIKRLQRAYGYYVDKGMGASIGNLFSDRGDASVEIGGSGVYIGKESISEFYADAAPPLSEGQLFNHMVLQGVVHVAEDGLTAQGRWRGLIQTGMHGESADWAEGPYENTYVREDGVWKFHTVRWYPVVMAPYDPGWHLEPRSMPGPSAENPPDAPPSDDYAPFPAGRLPPYHFENPVTGPQPAAAQAPEAGPVPNLAEAWQRLAAVETRAARVDDVNAIEKLQRVYGYYTDKMLWDDVVDLFAEDGTLEVGPSGVYAGHSSIRDYLYSLSGGQVGPIEGELYEHMQLQPIVTVAPDGRTARARWRAFMQLGRAGSGSGGTWGDGVYENAYVREDGVWKISSLRFDPTFLAPYEGGWRLASPEMVDDYAMGRGVDPDSGPTREYAAYPAVHVTPFHYDGAEVGAVAAPELPAAADPPDGAEVLEAAVAEAASRVERLADVDALENLSGIYGFYVDMSMHDDVADLFHEDGVVEILGRGVFEGLDRVREYMHNLGPVGPRPGRLFNHMHLQPVITIAPDGMSAQARSRLFVMFGILGTNAQYGAGIYENDFIKEDGVWKLDYLHGYQTFYTLYEEGWAERASAIFAPYPQLPPDRPQSVAYDPYPAAFVPPFHYSNPVTGVE